MGMLAPTFFVQKFGLSQVQMSGYVSAAQIAHIPAGFVVTALESVLVKRGVRTLTIRRWMTGLGSFVEAVTAVGYGLARTPLQAAIAYALCDSASQLHSSGAWPNYYEVGGEDTVGKRFLHRKFKNFSKKEIAFLFCAGNAQRGGQHLCLLHRDSRAVHGLRHAQRDRFVGAALSLRGASESGLGADVHEGRVGDPCAGAASRASVRKLRRQLEVCYIWMLFRANSTQAGYLSFVEL